MLRHLPSLFSGGMGRDYSIVWDRLVPGGFVMSTDAATKEQLGGKTLKGAGGDSKEKTPASSKTAENAEGGINPSAPGETGTTPGTNGKR